jgi:hypothetical protein
MASMLMVGHEGGHGRGRRRDFAPRKQSSKDVFYDDELADTGSDTLKKLADDMEENGIKESGGLVIMDKHLDFNSNGENIKAVKDSSGYLAIVVQGKGMDLVPPPPLSYLALREKKRVSKQSSQKRGADGTE